MARSAISTWAGPPGAPVVLCVHGLGGSALNWGLLAPLLSRTHRVLAVDLFGHGRSGVLTGPRPDALTADRRLIGRFIREVVGEPVVLLGHSMGGVLTILHAAARPGSDDPLAKAGPARALAATRSDWAFEVRPGAGLLLALEDPTWTADRILAGDGPGSR
jgi:pimeloyl-ACP methyl ester carboxylesterase